MPLKSLAQIIHGIDKLDADRNSGAVEKGGSVALIYEPHTESGSTTDASVGWIVPSGRMWVITHAALANHQRKARGRMNIIDSHSANAAWGCDGPEALDIDRYSDCLYYHTRPQYAHPGETVRLFDGMRQAGDTLYYSLRYYEVAI